MEILLCLTKLSKMILVRPADSWTKFMLHAIKKTRIHEEVVSQVHELIKEGKFKAGDQLPSERELAETFKVSRTSVREALRALETQGLIISRTGMGNFVADLPIESLVAPLARMLIEEKEQVQRGATGVEADSELHFAIGQATQNQAIKKLVFGLMDVLSRSREESLQPEARRHASIESHRAIVIAIEKHDPVKARDAMRHHIEQVPKSVLMPKRRKSSVRPTKKI